jgi:hypothetical protein
MTTKGQRGQRETYRNKDARSHVAPNCQYTNSGFGWEGEALPSRARSKTEMRTKAAF